MQAIYVLQFSDLKQINWDWRFSSPVQTKQQVAPFEAPHLRILG